MCYFVTVSGSEECATRDVAGSHTYMLYSEEEKAKMCKVVRTEEVKLPRVCAFFGHGNVQHPGEWWKGIQGLLYHL